MQLLLSNADLSDASVAFHHYANVCTLTWSMLQLFPSGIPSTPEEAASQLKLTSCINKHQGLG